MEAVRNWLRGLGLGQYAPKFEELGWETLEILQHMGPEDIKECIDKPGHRKQFELGLKSSNDAATLKVESCSAADKLASDTESDSDKDEAAVVTAGADERVERVVETIYVKGASNKILKSGLGKQSKKELKEDEIKLKSICGGSMSRGFLTVSNNLQG